VERYHLLEAYIKETGTVEVTDENADDIMDMYMDHVIAEYGNGQDVCEHACDRFMQTIEVMKWNRELLSV